MKYVGYNMPIRAAILMRLFKRAKAISKVTLTMSEYFSNKAKSLAEKFMSKGYLEKCTIINPNK